MRGRSSLYRQIITVLLITLVTCTLSQNAQAVLSVSEEEKAVFAFMKLTKQEPNYERWILESEKHTKASKYDKESIMESEKTRLGWGFGTYDVTKDFIKVKSNIRLTTTLNDDGERLLNIRFSDETQNETPYFPFPYGQQSVAFIVEELEKFRTITLQPEEIPLVKKYFYDSAPYEAEIELRLRPLSADNSAPLEVDGLEQWLMLGDIAYLKIQFYDDFKLEDIIVWDYNAPWYLSESQRALLELFKE